MNPSGVTTVSGVREPRGDPARHDALVRSIVERTQKLHELPVDLPAEEAAAVRRRAVEALTRTRLPRIGDYSFDAQRAAFHNCENLIGGVQVPLGVVGPLPVRGEEEEGEVFVPLATTEGALVASINRGCAAIAASGGAVVRVDDVGMTRAPVFRTSGIAETWRFLDWVDEHVEELRWATESTSQYLRLLEVRPFAFGTTVFLRFRFSSGDAMGMNMVTIACDHAVRTVIEPATGIRCVSLSGNYCVDKKVAAVNFQEGRGKRIHAEAVVGAPVLRRYLKTTAAALVEAQYRKNLLGSIAAGSLSYNAHYANVVAAFFLATGQDIAQVVEGSLGVTCIEARGRDAVFVSVFLPDVPLAAVGGGTALETQREALTILGIESRPDRPGRAALRLAEILGATVLAGELSLMAALSSQDLARAHQHLGRGGAENGGPPRR